MDDSSQIQKGTRVLALNRDDIIASWQHAVVVEKIEKDQTYEIRWDNSFGKYIVKDLADLRLLGQIEDDTLIWHPSTQILLLYKLRSCKCILPLTSDLDVK